MSPETTIAAEQERRLETRLDPQIPHSTTACAAGVFCLSLLLTTALNWRVIGSFFIVDDLSMLRIIAVPSAGWGDCFARWSNGFWRPTVLVATRLLWSVFGYAPVPYHVAQFVNQALCAALVFAFARSQRCSMRVALLSSAIFTTHLGTWPTVAQFSNHCDSVLTVCALSALIAWKQWLDTNRLRYLMLNAVFLAGALASKETAFVLPVILFVTASQSTAGRRKGQVASTICFGLALILAFWSLHAQARVGGGYVSTGRIRFLDPSAFRRFLDYWTSLVIPYLHAMTPVGCAVTLSRKAFWVVRGVVLVLLVTGVLRFAPWKGRCPVAWLCLAAASIMLLPVALVADATSGYRYLYPALPFVSVLLSLAFWHIWDSRYRVVLAFWLILWAWFVCGFLASPTVTYYVSVAADVKKVVAAMRREAPHWSRGDLITILNHPHPGGAMRWVYCQHLAFLFVPEPKVTIALERTPRSAFTYSFDHGDLVLLASRSAWPSAKTP